MFSTPKVKVFSTTGSEVLAQDVFRQLQTKLQPRMGDGILELGTAVRTRFSNDNIQLQVDNVRGYFIVIVHTQVPPVNDHLVELFALIDAIRNSKPADILLVFGYLPYARSDQKNQPRISTMGPLVLRILNVALDIKRFLLLDPHDPHLKHQVIPAAEEVTAIHLLTDYLGRICHVIGDRENFVVAFPDEGSARRYKNVPHLLDLGRAYIDKDRPDNTEHPVFKGIVGDIYGKTCLMIDDEILTGGTAISDSKELLKAGAASVQMAAIHAPLSDKERPDLEVVQRLEESSIQRFIVTDSIPVRHKLGPNSKFVVLSVAPLLAEAITREVLNESLTELYDPEKVGLYRN